jgi:Mor family transcriptional regulator
MSHNRKGQFSRRGSALLHDLRDHTAKLLTEANFNAEKADQVANELMFHISSHWGGQLLYVGKSNAFVADKRDIQIYNEFTGHNQSELAEKYDLTTTYIYKIVKRMHEMEKNRRQPDLFSDGE